MIDSLSDDLEGCSTASSLQPQNIILHSCDLKLCVFLSSRRHQCFYTQMPRISGGFSPGMRLTGEGGVVNRGTVDPGGGMVLPISPNPTSPNPNP